MKARELPLVALRAFAVAARAPSLTAAASELGVTDGAISKQINASKMGSDNRCSRARETFNP